MKYTENRNNNKLIQKKGNTTMNAKQSNQNNISVYRAILCISILSLLVAACEMPAPNDPGGNGNGSGGNNSVTFTIPISQTGTVAEGETITLSAPNASATRAGSSVDISGYTWELVTPQGGLAGVNILSPNAPTTQVELPYLTTIDVGQSLNLGFRLTATAGGETGSETVTVNLTNVFEATVFIDQTGTVGEAADIMLSGARSVITGENNPTYQWEQVNPRAGVQPAQFTTPNAATTMVTLPFVEEASETLTFRLTISAGNISRTSDTTVQVSRGDIDLDSDGLIDIRGLTMLHNMRYSLNGSSYKTSATDGGAAANAGLTTGCPEVASVRTCFGYELVSDLNFDLDGDGSTWTGSNGSYILDADDSQAPYFVVDGGTNDGWERIGRVSIGSSNPFTGVFNGNGYTIYNFAVVQIGIGIGLFGTTNADASISSIHFVNALAVGSSATGIIAGSSFGPVLASSSSGEVYASEAFAGGLMGSSESATIASYSSAQVSVNPSSIEFADSGGLVGSIDNTITSPPNESVLVRASYATGNVTTGESRTGSLIGINFRHEVTASYATGNASGTTNIGNFIGRNLSSLISESYGFGTPNNNSGTALPTVSDGNGGMRAITVSELTAANAGDTWNCTASSTNAACTGTTTRGAWDFTRRAINGGPSLMYADYDGPNGNRYYCDGQSEPSWTPVTDPRPIRIANCGDHLPHQFAEN